MNYFIKPDYSNLKTFVINLDDYKENYIKQLPYLENIGLKVERFIGINALKDQHLNPEYKKYISKFALNFTPKAVIGCALSHILCCKYIYNNYINSDNNSIELNKSSYGDNTQFFLILEDDAFPTYNKSEFYEKLNETINEIQILDSNWEIIQLYKIGIIDTYDTFTSHILHGSTVAYLININGIKKNIKSKVYNHVDIFTYNSLLFKKYNSKKNLFYSNEENSLTRNNQNNNIKLYILSFINKYFNQFLINKNMGYDKLIAFKVLKLPYFKKEYSSDDLIFYLLGFILTRKIINYIK